MKHFYSLVLLMLCSALGVSAQDVYKYTFNVDDPAAVRFQVAAQDVEIHAGDNTFELAPWTNITIIENSGYKVSVTDPSGYPCSLYNGSCYIYPSADNAGQTWTVTSSKIEFDRAVTIVVDEPSKVQVSMEGNNQYLILNAGENVVPYSSQYTTYLTVNDYDNSLYSVTVGGNPVEWVSGQYTISLPVEGTIEIKANYPDIDCPVRFAFVNPGTEGFLTGVILNYENVAPEVYTSGTWTVKAGSKVAIHGDTELYNVNSVAINGLTDYFSGYRQFVVKGETVVTIDVTKISTVSATITLEGDPEGIEVLVGYKPVTLTPGDNTVEFLSSNNSLRVNYRSGYYLTELTVDGQSFLEDSYGMYLHEGSVAKIGVAKVVRDKSMVVYLNFDPSSWTYFSFMNNDRDSYNLTKGYNVVEFADSDNPFAFSYYVGNEAVTKQAVVLNGSDVPDPEYGQYNFRFADSDVLKIFFGSEAPAMHPVQFDVTATALHTIHHDMVTPFAADAAVVKSFHEGTVFHVTPAYSGELYVTVNDVEVPEVGGRHEFTVTAPTNVKVANVNTGIESVDASATGGKIYNLQGIEVSSDFNSLPAGIYIRGGRKISKL